MLDDFSDPAAVEIVNMAGSAPILLTCEHASNHVPDGISLGVGPDALQSHIGYDIGAAAVTRRLAELLDAPAILSRCSRLVIDCNRPLLSPESIPDSVAGIEIPGNRGLSAAARAARARLYFQPFHDAIAGMLHRRDADVRHLLVSMHSFTPRLGDVERPWDVGVLQRRSPTIGTAMVDAFRAAGLNAIANQPYQIDDETDATVPMHGEAHGRPAILIELRQDRIDTAAGVQAWSAHTADAIRAVLR
ncbi:N-formylglutamate amidohydrolase [Sphingomonas colocasiae]|uniref:N-formylglutamate amidohydrolase n=1 Tax=Sphingomonas colocasiae TaxID=1848973 RepID=A0ABS7PVG2_9SPHN|nr:N-formylglutamate amidohydrolase [Sphingomonas colocasiae]MBY8825350.1 N-formylglutamate amidohydrolase [Sphingomonas colocasiae]